MKVSGLKYTHKVEILFANILAYILQLFNDSGGVLPIRQQLKMVLLKKEKKSSNAPLK